MNSLALYISIFIFLLVFLLLSFYEVALKNILQNLVKKIFDYRYAICFLILLLIIGLGFYLSIIRGWSFKDIAQVCTGFFIVITLFFTALNYEFAASKTKNDIKSARNTLTFNTAAEWHKSPVKDYEKEIINYEQKYFSLNAVRDIENFELFIGNPENTTYKESIRGVLNYLETVSIGTYDELIDKNFIKKFHRSIFKLYYVDYYFYISHRRELRKNDSLWVNFTNLAEEWHPTLKADLLNGIEKSGILTTFVYDKNKENEN